MLGTSSVAAGTSLLILTLAAAATPAGAAILRVPTAAFPVIQAAVDAAAPGDVVQVRKGGGAGPNGEYLENVVVEKPIRLVCLGSAVIDVMGVNTTRAGRDFSDGISVIGPGGNGAKVEGCVVKYAKPCTAPSASCPTNSTDGNGIFVGADSVVVKNCRAVGNTLGITVQGNGGAVVGTTLAGNFSIGMQVTGDGFLIAKNRIGGGVGSGFVVSGNGGQVRSNTISATLSSPLSVSGNGNSIRNNVVKGGLGVNLAADGTANLVANNVVRGGMQGLMVTGETNVVTGNKIEDAAITGILVTATTACGAITRNVANNSMMGMQLDCPAGSPDIRANVATDCSQFGMMISASATPITGNKVSGNGFAGIMVIDGADLVLTGNIAADNFGSGIVVMGAGNNMMLARNKAIRNGWDGIDVNRPASTGVVYQGNVVLNNDGAGIESDASGAAMTGNRALGNRTDIAGKGAGGGTVGSFSGNVFRTGGTEATSLGTGLF